MNGAVCLNIALLIIVVVMWGWRISDNQRNQTALLARIAIADEQIAAQTKTPVSIRVDGFSPEAQQVFNAAVRPKSRGK